MSWFSGSSAVMAEFETKIYEATSESIPNGELDLSTGLDITDLIRSKKIPPKQCMRGLKKRLTSVYQNPNLLTSTLKLTDLCVKNGGYHFLVEISSKEFIDYLVDYIFKIHYDVKDPHVAHDAAKERVGEFILHLVKEWKVFFKDQMQLNYVEKCYNRLKNEGYQFPEDDITLNSKFVDSNVPPDWVDNDECMICYTAFSVMNRKHHCRSCGGVFCQKHSSHNSKLVSLGIHEPVRVCDNCYAKLNHRRKESIHDVSSKGTRKTANEEEVDEDLKKALELSLRESSSGNVPFIPKQDRAQQAPAPQASEEDEEMKAAIEASLKEFQEQEKRLGGDKVEVGNNAVEPQGYKGNETDFYSNLLPQADNRFSQARSKVPTQPSLAQQRVPQKKQMEDLTQQEEQQINLFITIMNQMKSDPQKRSNILYDSDLSELYTKIIKLKPKINKSLRAAVERYEKFLEMNNKISTIARLYDSFLESKLSQMYGNHTISSQPHMNPSFTGSSQGYPSRQESTPFPNQGVNPPLGYPISQQSTGFSQQSTGFSQQSTGFAQYEANGANDRKSRYALAQKELPSTPSRPVETPYEQTPSDPSQSQEFRSNYNYNTNNGSLAYNAIDPRTVNNQQWEMGPSEPSFDDPTPDIEHPETSQQSPFDQPDPQNIYSNPSEPPIEHTYQRQEVSASRSTGPQSYYSSNYATSSFANHPPQLQMPINSSPSALSSYHTSGSPNSRHSSNIDQRIRKKSLERVNSEDLRIAGDKFPTIETVESNYTRSNPMDAENISFPKVPSNIAQSSLPPLPSEVENKKDDNSMYQPEPLIEL